MQALQLTSKGQVYSSPMRHLTRSLLVAAAASISLSAGPITYTTPNLDTTAVGATKSVSFGGATYLNKGLVGVGVFSASTIDGLGDTLGSFSSFKVDVSTWRRTPTAPTPAPSTRCRTVVTT